MPVKNYSIHTIGWWLKQEEYRNKMINLIFEGNLRRPPKGLQYSVYQIMEFEAIATPVVTVSLLDLSPKPDGHGRREDLITVNLRNYTAHMQVAPEDIREKMYKHQLNTAYLLSRGYAQLAVKKA